MKRIRALLLLPFFFPMGCANPQSVEDGSAHQSDNTKIIATDACEIHRAEKEKAVLILYPGGGNTSVETKEEFDIIKKAKKNHISVILMNFNNHLWLNNSTCESLTDELETIFTEFQLNRENVYIGGMSMGGNVALILTDHLICTSSKVAPKGVFVVDSPIDLYALFLKAQKDLLRKGLSEERLAEPRWIVNFFEKEFMSRDSMAIKIAAISPFVLTSKKTGLTALRETKLRFYTEPDSLWWRENRGTDFEDTNAFVIRQISKQIKGLGWKKFEMIETKGKGYRTNGNRHPHSWSIVEVDNLIKWITE